RPARARRVLRRAVRRARGGQGTRRRRHARGRRPRRGARVRRDDPACARRVGRTRRVLRSMKRVLLFLLVFGLGFAALWFFRSERSRTPDVPAVEAPAPEGQFTEIPLAGKDGKQGKVVGVSLDGPLKMTLRGG